VSGRIAKACATTAIMTAIPADRRVEGMLCLAAGTLYQFDEDSTDSGAGVFAPDAGGGRWISAVGGGATDYKDSARAASTANLVATRTGAVLLANANGALAAQDGVTMAVNDRILVKNQSTGADNGIYVVTSLGSAGTKWSFTRAVDFNTSEKVTSGATIPVTDGTANGDKLFVLTTSDAITLDTTALTFSVGGSGLTEATSLVANKAALALINGAALDDNVQRFVVSYQQPWRLDKTSALALVDDMIIAAVGGGQWLRQIEHAPRWTNQFTWGVDTSAGSDENSGADTVGNRLKTLTEVARRLACFNYSEYTINVIGTVAATDTAKWSGRIMSEGTATGTSMVLNIIGVRTPVAGFPGGTIGVVTATDVSTSPSTGLSQATIADAAVADWTPYADPATTTKSKLLVITGGPNAGLTAWTLFANPDAASSVLNAGADPTRVRVSNWTNATTATINGTAAGSEASAAVVAALAGQTYTINDVSPYLAANNVSIGLPPTLQVKYKNFQFSTTFSARFQGSVAVSTTKHVGAGGGGTGGSLFSSQGGQLLVQGSLVHFSASGGVIAGSPSSAYEMKGSAFINAQLNPNFAVQMLLVNCTLQSSYLLSGSASQNKPGNLGMVSINGAFGLGVYDAPTAQAAIRLRRCAICATEAVLHGFGAVGASLAFMLVENGGVVMIKTGIVPTGTNTGGQLKLAGSVTALQSLEAAIPGVQAGTGTLAAGSATIPAVLDAASRIKVSMNDPGAGAITGFASFEVPAASRTLGTPGTFVVNAIDDAKALIGTAVSTFDWEVANDPPIGVPLSLWSQWAAAVVPHVSGFGRNVTSQTDGSKIIDFTGSN